MCRDGWSWLARTAESDYEHSICIAQLRGRADFTSVEQCQSALDVCMERTDAAAVIEPALSVCETAAPMGKPDCDVPLSDLTTCWIDNRQAYVDSAMNYSCDWVLAGSPGNPLSAPESCVRLPAGCRTLLGFGPG